MSIDPEQERALLARAKRGEVAAFTELVLLYQSGLFRLLRLRAKSRANAEDALQETMVAAWRHLRTYRDRWRFSTWLYRIGLRELMKQERAFAADGEEVPEVSAPDDPFTWTSDQKASVNLWALARFTLDRDSVTALWLRYGQDFSVREVAQSMDRSSAWVKVRLFRARRQLQECVLVKELGADLDGSLAAANGRCQ